MRAALMTTCALALAGALAACSDPTLSVRVDVPAAYRAQVATISLADYESATLSCDGIAFGDVSAAELDGALTTQVELAPGAAAPLTGVARVDRKVLVARGLDARGAVVVAGCTAVGTVDGDLAVDIATVPVALASIDQIAADRSFAVQPLRVHVLDALGAPLVERAVVWRVFGPKGAPGGATGAMPCPLAMVDGCTTTGDQGDATLAVTPPAQPGPVLAEVRVAWARAQPAPVGAFTAPTFAQFSLRQSLTAPPSACAAYHGAAGVRVACLATAVGGGLEVWHFGYVGGSVVKLPVNPSVPGAFALITVPGAATDHLYALTTGGQLLDGTTGAVAGTAPFPSGVGAPTAVAAQLVPACGKAAFVVVGFSDGSVRTFDTTGGALATFVPTATGRKFDLTATGCLSDVGSAATQYRTVVFSETRADNSVVPAAFVDCPTKVCQPAWVGFGGIGLVAGPGGEARLASGQISLTGTIVTEWTIDPSAPDGQMQLVAPHTLDSIGVPQAIASGDFDGDGAPDRAWLLTGGTRLSPTGRVELTLAATTDDGVPVQGVSADLRPAPTDLLVARVDDDAIDDVVLFDQNQLTIVLAGHAP